MSTFVKVTALIVTGATIAILIAGSCVCSGCETFSTNSFDRDTKGDSYLCAVLDEQREWAEDTFGIEYNRNLIIGWTEEGSCYRYGFNTILIDKSVKGTPALLEHVRHELIEAICWHVTGGYAEFEQPRRLGGILIEDHVPSWRNHYE